MENLASSNTPRFVRWAVVLGIVIVLNIVFVVIRAIVFPAPQYEDYCPMSVTNQPPAQTQDACVAAGGTWNYIAQPAAPASVGGTPAKVTDGYCDYTSKCSKQWEAAQKSYSQKGFAVMTVFGVLALIIGVLPLGSSIVSSGLSYGGVISLIIGSGMYWGEAGNWLRLAIAVVALAALVFIGLKRFRD
jgi:hypothetical protein